MFLVVFFIVLLFVLLLRRFFQRDALQRPILVGNVACALVRVAQLGGNVSSFFIAAAGQKGVAIQVEIGAGAKVRTGRNDACLAAQHAIEVDHALGAVFGVTQFGRSPFSVD